MSGAQSERTLQTLSDKHTHPSLPSSLRDNIPAGTANHVAAHTNPVSLLPSDNTDILIREATQLREDNDFLRKYVSRCESQLRLYQSKHPDLIQHMKNSDHLVADGIVDELPPWISSSKYTSPLLVAYEDRINELNQQNLQQQNELNELKREAEKLLERNIQIENELENNIQQLLTHIQNKENHDNNTNTSTLDGTETDEVEEQLLLYREQIDLLKSNEHDLRVELQNARNMYERKLDDISTAHNKQLVAAKNEVLNLTKRNEQLSKIEKLYDTLKREHHALKLQFTQQSAALLEANGRVETSDKLIQTHVSKQQALGNELEMSHKELENTLKTLNQLESSVNGYKSKEMSLMKQMNDNIEKTHTYELQRDAAVVKQAALQRENERLNEKLQSQQSELKKQNDEQLAAIYKQSKEQEAKLLNELKQMELSCIEMEGQKDGTIRQMGILKEQTEKLTKQSKNEIQTLRNEIHNLHTKNTEYEALANRSSAELQRAMNEHQRQSELWNRERELLLKQVTDSKQKVDAMESKFSHTYQQLLSLQQSYDTQSSEFNQSRRLSEQAIHRLETQLKQTETQRHSEVSSLRLQLDEAVRQHESSETAMATLVQQHETLLGKYREENKSNFTHFQKVLAEYKDKCIKLQSLYNIADNRLNEVERSKESALHALLQAEQTIQQLQAALNDAQQQSNQLRIQIQQSQQQYTDLQEENHTLQLKIDKNQMEVQRLHRDRDSMVKKQQFQAQIAGVMPNPNSYLNRVYSISPTANISTAAAESNIEQPTKLLSQ